MDPTPFFRLDDRQASLAFVAAYPFGVVVVNGEDGPVSAHVPLVLNDTGTALLGHVARANPFWKAAQSGASKAVAIFKGSDAYISPSFYASKHEHGRAVPTWNYAAVEICGTIALETQPDAMMPYIDALTNQMESGRADPWQISDAPADYIAKLSRGIVGFRLTIDRITHVKKLSQNKSTEDKQGVIAALQNSPHASEQAMAQDMIKEDN
ncbi:MAG: FMN-binding negative transcriptional regulator [Alphaproteobacteria bacterium]